MPARPSLLRDSGYATAQHAITMDWVATFLDIADVGADKRYPLDGISLLKTLQKPDRVVKRDLYWKMLYRNQRAMRSGGWKYLSVEGDEFLFNLALDERERANYGKREPKRPILCRPPGPTWRNRPDNAVTAKRGCHE